MTMRQMRQSWSVPKQKSAGKLSMKPKIEGPPKRLHSARRLNHSESIADCRFLTVAKKGSKKLHRKRSSNLGHPAAQRARFTRGGNAGDQMAETARHTR